MPDTQVTIKLEHFDKETIYSYSNSVKVLVDMYLDFVNNFISVARFAEYHGVSGEHARAMLDAGRAIYQSWSTYEVT